MKGEQELRRRLLQVCAVDFTAYHLLRPLMQGLREADWDVEFACADGPFAAQLRREGFRHRPIPMTRRISPARQGLSVAALAASLLRDRPALVHTHTPVGGIVGRTAAALARVPAVHTFHGLPLRDPAHPTRTERAFLAVERILSRRTLAFFSQASGDVDRAIALGIARRSVTSVIGNGVDIERFAPDAQVRAAVRHEIGADANDVVVLTVARLVKEKGLLELADAATALASQRQLRYVLVGQQLSSDRTGVAAELDAHPVRHALGIRWQRLGHRADVDRLLKAADIFVLPTYREGLPRSVIEALASGVPVVCSDIPACRELVDEASTGRLVPPRDAMALASAVAELASAPGLRAEMARRARQIAVARHDERDVVRRQVDALHRIVP